MTVSDKLAALKNGKFGGFGSPPKPDEAPQTMGKSEVIPDETKATQQPVPQAEASSPTVEPAKPAAKRRASSKKKTNSALPDGYVQLNGRVPRELHKKMRLAGIEHGKDLGEIIAEAFELWEKRHG